jgi:hypothetical protein
MPCGRAGAGGATQVNIKIAVNRAATESLGVTLRIIKEGILPRSRIIHGFDALPVMSGSTPLSNR